MFLLSVQCTWERVPNDPYMVMVLVHFLKVMPGSRTAWSVHEENKLHHVQRILMGGEKGGLRFHHEIKMEKPT